MIDHNSINNYTLPKFNMQLHFINKIFMAFILWNIVTNKIISGQWITNITIYPKQFVLCSNTITEMQCIWR